MDKEFVWKTQTLPVFTQKASEILQRNYRLQCQTFYLLFHDENQLWIRVEDVHQLDDPLRLLQESANGHLVDEVRCAIGSQAALGGDFGRKFVSWNAVDAAVNGCELTTERSEKKLKLGLVCVNWLMKGVKNS